MSVDQIGHTPLIVPARVDSSAKVVAAYLRESNPSQIVSSYSIAITQLGAVPGCAQHPVLSRYSTSLGVDQ